MAGGAQVLPLLPPSDELDPPLERRAAARAAGTATRAARTAAAAAEPPPRGTACWLAAGSGAARLAVTASVQIRCFIRFSASPVLTRLQVARSAEVAATPLPHASVRQRGKPGADSGGNVLAAVLPNGLPAAVGGPRIDGRCIPPLRCSRPNRSCPGWRAPSSTAFPTSASRTARSSSCSWPSRRAARRGRRSPRCGWRRRVSRT